MFHTTALTLTPPSETLIVTRVSNPSIHGKTIFYINTLSYRLYWLKILKLKTQVICIYFKRQIFNKALTSTRTYVMAHLVPSFGGLPVNNNNKKEVHTRNQPL